MVGITLCSCGQNQSSVRNKIFVKNNVYELADSLAVIGSLLQRLPKDEMINYFLDLDGNLYVNNRKLGPLKGAEKNMEIRQNSLFNTFSELEFQRFISLIKYMLGNNIDSSRKDNVTGTIIHEYRRTSENSFDDVREIIIDADTLSTSFKKAFQVIDKKGRLTLVVPYDVRIN